MSAFKLLLSAIGVRYKRRFYDLLIIVIIITIYCIPFLLDISKEATNGSKGLGYIVNGNGSNVFTNKISQVSRHHVFSVSRTIVNRV